jgi:hypothetical protein
MAAIAPAEAIGDKWARVTPQRSADFESGVRNPRKDWAAATAASVPQWEAGVQAAIANKSFGKGVARSGTSQWQLATVEKGVPRWGQGVALAQQKYTDRFKPYRDAIERTTLPQRFARRDPRNLNRVKAIVDALVKVKEAA